MNDIKFTTIDELIKLESLRARKKPPCDLQLNEKGLELEQYYSESKKGHLNLLEMPLDYLVRAFNKTLKKLNEKEPLKKYKVMLSVDEAYSCIIEAADELEANQKATEKFNNENPPYHNFKIEDGNGFEIVDTIEIK